MSGALYEIRMTLEVEDEGRLAGAAEKLALRRNKRQRVEAYREERASDEDPMGCHVAYRRVRPCRAGNRASPRRPGPPMDQVNVRRNSVPQPIRPAACPSWAG